MTPTPDQYNTIKAHPRHLLLTSSGLYYRGAGKQAFHIVPASEHLSAPAERDGDMIRVSDDQFKELTELAQKHKNA